MHSIFDVDGDTDVLYPNNDTLTSSMAIPKTVPRRILVVLRLSLQLNKSAIPNKYRSTSLSEIRCNGYKQKAGQANPHQAGL